jgi:hypothetical protein
MGLPGGVAVPPRLLAADIGGVQGVFSRGHLVVGGIEVGVRLLESGFRGRQRALGRVQPGAEIGSCRIASRRALPGMSQNDPASPLVSPARSQVRSPARAALPA